MTELSCFIGIIAFW